MTRTIDLNADLGEGIGNDALLMPWLSSCNIACGSHAGDVDTIRETVRLAIEHNVKIGAHPSYPDRENFGRAAMELSESELKESIVSQVNLVLIIAGDEGGMLHHIKPHGALYNQAAVDETCARVLIAAMHEFPDIILYAPENSVVARLAKMEGIEVCHEVFGDRNYNEDLSLVSREQPNAILQDTEMIVDHVLRMILENKVKTLTGVEKTLHADTICVHGDNPEAVAIVRALREQLTTAGITIE